MVANAMSNCQSKIFVMLLVWQTIGSTINDHLYPQLSIAQKTNFRKRNVAMLNNDIACFGICDICLRGYMLNIIAYLSKTF